MNFSLIDVVFLIILSQGLFLIMAIQLVPKKNKSANVILTYLLSIASIMLAGRIAIYRMQFDLLLRIATFIDATLFLFGPLLYCYIRRLAFREEKVFQLSRIHFVPVGIYVCYCLWTFTMGTQEFNSSYMNGSLNLAFVLTELFGLLSVSFYAGKSYLLYRELKKNQRKQLSYEQVITSYIRFLIVSITIFAFLWMYSFVSYYVFGKFTIYLNYNSMWLSTSIFMYFIGFYSLTQPQIFRISLSKETKEKSPKKKVMKADELTSLEHKLHHLMYTEKVFLIPDLNLSQLAKKAGTSSNKLSWYLNQVLDESFYEYINAYRIKEFIRLVGKGESKNKTLLAIAFDAGFNTKSTFNSSFKSIMNDTPKNYIKTHIDTSKTIQKVE